jgi:disulfide bond formation protein DsbB
MSTARSFAVALLLLSVAVVGGALLSQHVGGLQPCALCLYQRWPWYATIALALVVVLVGGRAESAWVLALCAAVLGAGAALAFYHVGVEQHWFAGPSSCGAAATGAATIEELKAQILGTAPVRCDEVTWSLFGLSMAGWNLLASLAVAGVALLGFRRAQAEATP